MKKYLLSILALVLVFGCVKDPEDNDDTQLVPPDPPEETEVVGKPRYVWIDASANFYYYANDKAFIAAELGKIADCGFTDIVVDVRPTEGTVLWKSAIAPQAKRLAAWVGSSYKFVNRTATFDYLQAFIDAGHAAGLRVHAAINTFVGGYGGYYGLESEGPIFTGEIPASWATVINTSEGLKSSYYDGVQGTVFLNPANEDVQAYVISLLKELAAYKPDGIILDRCRYDDTGLQSDFSDQSKAGFISYLGREPETWPVFTAGGTNLPSIMAPFQKAWMSFRVKTIHDFVEKAAAAVHQISPETKFGVYVGAWYSSYYTSGVNWASPRYEATKSYRWADAHYKNYGFADHCDQMLLGCYAATTSIYGATEWTMQGFCKLAQNIILGDAPFAGGPDVGNPTGWTDGKQSAKIPQTVDACINNADGYFVFDLCHIRMYDYWNAFKDTFEEYINSLTQ